MNTFQLSCFLAVANTLNFARAAGQMNISQPAITHQIQSLETELNVKLFRRSTRLVELTPEGRAFVSDAKSMVSIAEQAKRRFSDPGKWPLETLSIGCGSYNLLVLLTGSLNRLSQSYPKLHPRLLVVPYEQLYQLLENGTADVIFDIQDDAQGKRKLTFRELRQSPVVCVCRPDHPLAAADRLAMADLKEQPLIFSNPVSLVPQVAELQWHLAEGRSPAEIRLCASAEAAVVLAGAGFGMAVLPDFLVPPEQNIVKIPLENAPSLSFGMFYKPSPGDEILREFMRIARQELGGSSAGSPARNTRPDG